MSRLTCPGSPDVPSTTRTTPIPTPSWRSCAGAHPSTAPIQVAPVEATPDSTSDTLPLISIAAIATSSKTAEDLAKRQALALRDYVVLGRSAWLQLRRR